MLYLIRKFIFRRNVRRGSAYEAGLLALEQGDFARATDLWTPIAERGNSSAMYGLGIIADQYLGDMQLAAAWMRRAADKGLAIAYVALGRMYEIGNPYAQDFQEAARLYLDAARGGEAAAQVYLGQLYERGHGVSKDIDKAFHWYRKAADMGHADAIERLSRNPETADVR